jgi:hypothetical protein
VIPTVTKKTTPPTISSEYRTNIVRTMPVEFGSKPVCPARACVRYRSMRLVYEADTRVKRRGWRVRKYEAEWEEVDAGLGLDPDHPLDRVSPRWVRLQPKTLGRPIVDALFDELERLDASGLSRD